MNHRGMLIASAIFLFLTVPSPCRAGSYDVTVYGDKCWQCYLRHGVYGSWADCIYDWWRDNYYATLNVPQNFSKVVLTRILSVEPGEAIGINGTEVFQVSRRSRPYTYYDVDIDITSMVHSGLNIIDNHLSPPEYVWSCSTAMTSFHIETSECADADGDGHNAISPSCSGGNDCNDNRDDGGYDIHPNAAEICDNKDNDCDGTVDEGCTVMSYVSGTGQSNNVCKTLREPFVVKVENTGGAEVGVEWLTTDSPDGSNPAMTGNLVIEENDESIYKAYLKLGSKPGAYKAQAVCEQCTEGSPQEFAASAACPTIPIYRQFNYPDDPYDTWCKILNGAGSVIGKGICRDDQYDSSGNIIRSYLPYSIASKGCALTALSMVMGTCGSSTATPDVWNDFLTASGGYDGEANVRWDAIPMIDGQITRAINTSSSTPLPNTLMDDYLERCMPAIVKVHNPTTGNWHWVVVTGKSGSSYSIIDPNYTDRTALSAYGNKIYAVQVYRCGGCQ